MVVAVAKEYPGVPVKVIWSREETFRQGRFRTPIISHYKAVLDEDGYPKAVTARAVFVGTKPLFHGTQNFGDVPYFLTGVIPNVELSTSHMPMPILNGAYRGPGYNSHAFMVETFIDECAATAGIDQLAYRLKLVSKWDKAWTDCLKVAADKAGWGTPLPKGEGRGIAIAAWPMASMHNFGTIICAVAHVAVSKDGQLAVKQLDYAFDCGRTANADAVRAMIEGGAIFGMNMALNEELTVKNGAIVESNFDSYRMLRAGNSPTKINVHFDALSGHERLDIVGEAPVGPVGPAIANAIFAATGKRLRSTPLRKHDLRWA
jgi:isoquinoline 1-oxidoreductase beta subunit